MTMRGVSDIHENYEYNSSVYQIHLRGEGHVYMACNNRTIVLLLIEEW